MILRRFFNKFYPETKYSVWLGPRRSRITTHYNIGILLSCAIFAFIVFLIDEDAQALASYIAVLALVGGGILVLFLSMFTYFSRPWRVDFSDGQIEFIYGFRTKNIPISAIRETRRETIITTIKSKGTTSTYFDQQFVFDLDNHEQIKILKGRYFPNWTLLLKVLRTQQGILLLENKCEEDIRHSQFSTGSLQPWPHYLDDRSSVSVSNINEIETWLRGCQYITDEDQFNKSDHWLRPGRFEELMQGDCEDHAIWAWYQLKKLQIPAELVVGLQTKPAWATKNTVSIEAGRTINHAWVTFVQNGELFVLESTAKSAEMIIPWEMAQKRYQSKYSVNHHLQTFHHRPPHKYYSY